jgi:hypothetical protein
MDDQMTGPDIAKLILVESAKGYVQAVAMNVAALTLLAGVGFVVIKVQEFRARARRHHQ